MHLLITGLVSVPLTWALLHRFLSALPERIDLNIVVGPYVYRRADGFLGMVVVAESHISFHSKHRTAWIDVFSCKTFDADDVAAYVCDFFHLERAEISLLERIIAVTQPVNPLVRVPAQRGVS